MTNYIGSQPTSVPLTSSDITDGIITTAKIADDAVTGAKIENNPTIAGNLAVSGTTTLSDNIVFGASSKGIHLGVTSATSSNLLDDYEEGTWTPAIESGSFSGNVYGTYRKIGALVFIHFEMNTFSASDVTNPYMNLPFTAQNASPDYAGYFLIAEPYQLAGSDTRTYIYFRINKNQARAQMLSGGGDNGEYTHVNGVTISSGDHLRGNGFYFTDA